MDEAERSSTSGSDEAAVLGLLGHKQELRRSFSVFSMLGFAFAILNTWTALAASLSLSLPSGGSSAVVWGLVVAGLCNFCLAASLAEFLSAYPTAGGQYHWAAIIAWERSSRAISYATAWISISGWVALSATGGLLGSNFVVNIISLLHPSYAPQPWHQFLIYIAFTAVALAFNSLLTHLLPLLTKAAFFWSVSGIVVISVTVLACAAPDYQSATFVYGGFINSVGWPDGLAWLLGLLQGAFALAGIDATAHMIEEMSEPEVQGPRIMLYCVGIGVLSGFILVSCLLFCVSDVDRVISAVHGPLLQLLMDATKSRAGSTCLVMFPLIASVFTSTTLMSTSSRMIYAFARDRGMPFSRVFAQVHPRLTVPLNALLWAAAWDMVFGFILLGSSSTMNAIVPASVVALGVTYVIPVSINVLRGRKMLPEERAFKLKEPLGWILNLVGILWSALTTVLFLFPPKMAVTPSNMNYAVCALGVILLVAGLTWILDGRKNFKGPPVGALSANSGARDRRRRSNRG